MYAKKDVSLGTADACTGRRQTPSPWERRPACSFFRSLKTLPGGSGVPCTPNVCLLPAMRLQACHWFVSPSPCHPCPSAFRDRHANDAFCTGECPGTHAVLPRRGASGAHSGPLGPSALGFCPTPTPIARHGPRYSGPELVRRAGIKTGMGRSSRLQRCSGLLREVRGWLHPSLCLSAGRSRWGLLLRALMRACPCTHRHAPFRCCS